MTAECGAPPDNPDIRDLSRREHVDGPRSCNKHEAAAALADLNAFADALAVDAAAQRPPSPTLEAAFFVVDRLRIDLPC